MSSNIEITRGTPLERQVWLFTTANLGNFALRLIRYTEETRPSKRHKWRGDFWSYMDERKYHSKLDRPKHIPQSVLYDAREELASRSRSAPIYVGWIDSGSLYKEGKL